ncbi:hypothetical protein ACFXEL_07300 [Streptomyces sp. NPDC059382]|uniref:hypothetical protein n=1 Tax=Streptomyces sp. NPDC059382 TaxID=3346816 RepID=UPI0036971306
MALSVWAVRVLGTGRPWRPWEGEFTCPCCGEGRARDKLHQALFMLPPKASAELRSRVAHLDAVLRARTYHEPASDPESAWWHRRC